MRVYAVGHLALSWHQVPYNLDLIHESWEEEVEVMKEPEVLLCFPDLDPMQHEGQVKTHNESLTYSEDDHEAAEAGFLAGKSSQVAGESRQGHGNSNPDVEWILYEPSALDRSSLDLAQSPSSAPAGRAALGKPARRESLGRNMGRVSNPGQGDALLVEVRTNLLPLRMTENSVGPLLLLAARRHSQPCPTDPHSLLMYPNCGSDQGSIVC